MTKGRKEDDQGKEGSKPRKGGKSTKGRKEVNQGKEGINQDKEGSQLREGRKMT